MKGKFRESSTIPKGFTEDKFYEILNVDVLMNGSFDFYIRNDIGDGIWVSDYIFEELQDEEYDYDVDTYKDEQWYTQRVYKALKLACDAIRSSDIMVRDETRFMLSAILNEDLEGYFISEANKLMDE